MKVCILILFCVILLACVCFGVSVVPALAGGLLLFMLYALISGYSLKDFCSMCASGIRRAGNILITFLFIGVLTAFWRVSGCIPAIVCYTSGLALPALFPLAAFLLNALLSILTGTAFGTAATMGVICMSLSDSLGLDPFWTGGAILAGAYFGDRCSPVSTSALLVSSLTGTDVYRNIRAMLRSCLVPFLVSCCVYAAAGLFGRHGGTPLPVRELFAGELRLHPICVLPAVCILIAAALRWKVRRAMLLSIAVSVPIALFYQRVPVLELLRCAAHGYAAADPAVGALLNGGGLQSMLRVAVIVCIASCYAGVFEKTGLLEPLERLVSSVSERFGSYPATLFVAAAASAAACNQTLSIMLTSQLTSSLKSTPEEKALDLEDTAVVLAPLIPWSIAGGVPLASVGAPTVCILGACYLYLLPLWRLLRGRKPSETNRERKAR